MVAKRNNSAMALIGVILSISMGSPLFAEESGGVKDGFYLEALLAYNAMSGDFDDSGFLVSPFAIYDVPDVDSGMGFGLVAGFRQDRYPIEFGYQRTTHDTHSSFVDVADSTAFYNVFDMNLKVDVVRREQFRPYVLVGFGFPWLTIEDSSTSGGPLEDETFWGFDVDVGAGVAYYFSPRWAVMGGLIYRWNWFASVEDDSIDDSLLESALGFTLGVAFTF